MLLATGQEVFWGAQIFLKGVFKQIFCGQSAVNINHKVTKIGCAFVYRKNIKVRFNLLFTLRATFLKIRAPQKFLDPVPKVPPGPLCQCCCM